MKVVCSHVVLSIKDVQYMSIDSEELDEDITWTTTPQAMAPSWGLLLRWWFKLQVKFWKWPVVTREQITPGTIAWRLSLDYTDERDRDAHYQCSSPEYATVKKCFDEIVQQTGLWTKRPFSEFRQGPVNEPE